MKNKPTILYIDDDQENLDLYSEVFENDFNMITISDPDSIYPLLSKTIFDAALVDIHMPLMDGFEVIKKIKRHPSGPDIALFFFSSDETKMMKLKGLGESVSDYLYKSMDIDELSLRISKGIKGFSSQSHILSIGNLKTNFSTFQVFINDSEIHLTLTEYKILMFLAKSAAHQVDKQDLKDFAYFQEIVSDNNLRVHLANLRSKLGGWNHIIISKGNRINIIHS
jgi:DNA-binding response OmpR family regulator